MDDFADKKNRCAFRLLCLLLVAFLFIFLVCLGLLLALAGLVHLFAIRGTWQARPARL